MHYHPVALWLSLGVIVVRFSVNKTKSDDAGYTLLELLVVLGIIAALSALVAPRVIGYLGQAKSDAARAQLANVQSAIELYYLDTGNYPTAEQGIPALVTAPPGSTAWKGPYLKNQSGLADPWGRPYIYKIPGQHGAFDLSSLGRDGAEGGEGEDKDIVSW
jgi:general secretion pathway protein G